MSTKLKLHFLFALILLAHGSIALSQLSTFDSSLDPKRRYDQVTFLTAHNAFANTEDGWLYAQQGFAIPTQLELGVRGLMLDIHMGQGGVIEKECRDVKRAVNKTEEQCKTVVQQDCKNEKTVKDECKKQSKKVCKWAPWPASEICDTVTKTVCTPVEVVEKVCKNVDKLVCAPGTVVEWVTDKVCDGANVLITSGNKRPRLCHEKSGDTNCLLSRTVLAPLRIPKPLSDALTDVRKFLDGNPKAIITIFFESYINDKAQVDREFSESGINKYVFDQEAWLSANNKSWPTIQQMRDMNKRLVVFTGGGKKDKGWPQVDGRPNNWRYVVETEYDLAEYKGCEIRSETKENVADPQVTLLTINHFYKWAIGQPYVPVAGTVLNNPVQIAERIDLCRKATKRLPNFIALDFVENALGVWPIINGLNSTTVER